MARVIMCDLCHEKEAAFMYTVFADGTTIAGCEDDAGQFAIGLAISLGALPDPLTFDGGTPEPGNGEPLPQAVIDEIEAYESGEPIPDPVTDEPTDEPADAAPEPLPKRRRRPAA